MPGVIRKQDLRRETGLSHSTVFRLEKAGRFPRRFNLTERLVAWDRDEVERWVAARRASAEKSDRAGVEA